MKKVILIIVAMLLIITTAACSTTPCSPNYQGNSVQQTAEANTCEPLGNLGSNAQSDSNVNHEVLKNEGSDNAELQTEDSTNESAGVPQSQIEYEMFPEGEEYFVDECVHDVDLDAHWDVVTVRYRREQEYLTTHYAISAVYQYDKASDLWTKIPNSNKKSFDYTLPESLIGETFQGNRKALYGYVWYSVTVEEINTMDGWFHLSYDIVFAEKEYSGEAYVEYGEFSVNSIEGLFTITFDPQYGFVVSR